MQKLFGGLWANGEGRMVVIIIISILTGLWLAERFGMNEGRLRGMFSFSPTGLTLNTIFGLIDV